MKLSESVNNEIHPYVPNPKMTKRIDLLLMCDIWIYDLETIVLADGTVQVFAMGLMSLEECMKSKSMSSSM